ALASYQIACKQIEKLSIQYRSEQSKLALGEETHEMFVGGASAAYQLFQLTGDPDYKSVAYSFAQRSKACVLRQILSDEKAKQFAGIPDSMLTLESKLKLDIAFYQKKIREQQTTDGLSDSSKIASWQSRLFSLKRQFENLVRGFEQNYPEYYRLKYHYETISPFDMQQQLSESNLCIIEYLLGNSALFVFILSRDIFDLIYLKIESDFVETIHELRASLVQRTDSSYINNAHILYQKIIVPIQPHITNKKLVIIPDGMLGYIPFEALLCSNSSGTPNNFRQLDYLIFHHQIRYHYSASLMFQSPIRKPNNRYRFVGFAPVEFW
ncbi:MAG TPA: CHAT domain-containing protein, partial [bacterium]|nr:CHAT domain-containing protein [bacterium]